MEINFYHLFNAYRTGHRINYFNYFCKYLPVKANLTSAIKLTKPTKDQAINMKHIITSTIFILCGLYGDFTTAQVSITSDQIEINGLEWRNIGPFRGGRANAISGVIGNDQIYYAGYTGGGVWKTKDGGRNWFNISDGYFKSSSVGDIAVSKQDPNVVYVGTGEHAVRGVMTTYGDGVYKSVDAGQSWEHLGLEGTRHISDVIIDPKNDDVVYVGAQGPVHGASEERGVYKSMDGGKTWKNILFVNEDTGVSSLMMDPSNHRILYAATWDHRRLPWKVISGGEGSSVYKSTDSGNTWTKITNGLPEMMGKIGLSVSPVDPQRVYALVESEKEVSGMYRSDDGGGKWTLMSNDQNITARSWYYMEVFADPNNVEVVYALNAPLMKSIDGGKTFKSMRVVHGDCHDLWINPDNSNNIAMAEDGGGTITWTGGEVWSDLNNQPTAQFYRITADEQYPYWVYSGQQDNLSVAIPSRTKTYGILTRHWYNGPGCESAMVAMDNPKNPRVLYGGCFNGRISLLDNKTMETKDIMPYPMTNLGYDAKDMAYRFNWNSPLINSPHNPQVMYYGGNVVFKTTNGGLHWDVISPDLTRNEVEKQGQGGGPFTNEGAGGENYNTIYYIVESPHQEGLIYTGSDCGKVFITKDGGNTWNDVTPEGIPEIMIHAMEVSPHQPGTIYIAGTRYKFNDFNNYSYKSVDYGESWMKIGDDIQADDFFKVVREDKKVPGILYAGGERGFYISFDGGKSFNSFQLNFPVVPITDLTIRDNDLAASTAGRSFWILDDLSVIQQSRGQLNKDELKLFQPKSYHRELGGAPFYLITEHAYGKNPPIGIQLDYFIPEVDERTLKLEILDSNGEVIRTYDGTADEIVMPMQGGRGNIPAINTEKLPYQKGLNRFVWDFRTQGLTKVNDVFVLGADYRGHQVAPGSYAARMTWGDQSQEVEMKLLDPIDINVSKEDWNEQQEIMEKIEKDLNEMHDALNNTIEMNKRIESISDHIESTPEMDDLRELGKGLKSKIKDWQSKVIELRQKGFQDALNWPAGMNAEFFLLRSNMDTHDPRVSTGYKSRFNDLNSLWRSHKDAYDEIINNDVPEFNELYRSKRLPGLMTPDPEKKAG